MNSSNFKSADLIISKNYYLVYVKMVDYVVKARVQTIEQGYNLLIRQYEA